MNCFGHPMVHHHSPDFRYFNEQLMKMIFFLWANETKTKWNEMERNEIKTITNNGFCSLKFIFFSHITSLGIWITFTFTLTDVMVCQLWLFFIVNYELWMYYNTYECTMKLMIMLRCFPFNLFSFLLTSSFLISYPSYK